MHRSLVVLLTLAILGALLWFAYGMLPLRLTEPGFPQFLLLFIGLMALPYVAALALLLSRAGRSGLRLAAGTALVNALWSLPLAGVLPLLGGFTMDNRDQAQSLLAVITAATLQIPLLLMSIRALRGNREWAGGAALRWPVAIVLPLVFSGASLAYFQWQWQAGKAQAAQATRNGHNAREVVHLLQACLGRFRDVGYPATLVVCGELSARTGETSGYRFQYLPAIAASDGRVHAFMLCATPLRFAVTGFETSMVDSSSAPLTSVRPPATLHEALGCAAVVAIDKAIAWCAFDYAAHRPTAGYPRRLANLAPCLAPQRNISVLSADRLMQDHQTYAYLAAVPDAKGVVAGFRIYRLGLAGGRVTWLDQALALPRQQPQPTTDEALARLPGVAVPERFGAGCEAGRPVDCFLAGYEWQRKAHQLGSAADSAALRAMRRAAFRAFDKACALRDARACTALATELEFGNDEARDVVTAAQTYERACTAGDANGCRRAADLYEHGRKVHVQRVQHPTLPVPIKADLRRDVPRAVALYGQACDLEERDACFMAGRILAAGESLPRDRDQAVVYFDRACAQGMALACTRAAEIAPAEAAGFRHRACLLGESSACK